LVEQAVYVGMTVPFAEASRLLGALLGVVVPADTVRRLSEEAGQEAVELEAEEVERVRLRPIAPDRPVRVRDRLQQVSVDGAMVPLKGGQWAEVKTVVIGRVEGAGASTKARDLSYFSRLGDHTTFTALATVEFDRRQTDEARAVVAVNDGAEWIGGFLDAHCPDAVRILDWPHAAASIGEAGQALFGPGTAECSAWVEAQLRRLWDDDAEGVVADLARREAHAPVAALRSTRQYLEKRLEQVRYATFRRLGYPVGSGIVESANKLVVEARLKRSGMHWSPVNVNALLALRCNAASGRWAAMWPRIRSRMQRPARHTQPPRTPHRSHPEPTAPAVVAPAPRPHVATVVDGRPTSAHPWKRYPACFAK
jgi:hypothetical protein